MPMIGGPEIFLLAGIVLPLVLSAAILVTLGRIRRELAQIKQIAKTVAESHGIKLVIG